jgi:hypothetical protein
MALFLLISSRLEEGLIFLSSYIRTLTGFFSFLAIIYALALSFRSKEGPEDNLL